MNVMTWISAKWDQASRKLGARPPPLAGEGWGGGGLGRIFVCAPTLSLPRKRGRGRCGTGPLKTKLCALALLALVGAAHAQEPYPTRPVRLVVGFGAGGPTDIPARFIADKLGEALGQRVVVENKPAAAGMIATRDVLAQPRDGYTLLLCTHFEAINTAVYKNAQFKLSDLAPISLIAKYYYGLALANAIPAADFDAFVHYAKAHPGEVTYATIGAGSAQEILARQLEKLTGISMNRIPFRGGPQVVQELIAGRVHFYVSPTLAIVPQYQAKQLKILAVSAPARLNNARRDSDAAGEGRRFRALRLARHLRRRRHAAAGRRPAAAPDRDDRRHSRIPRDDRKGRFHRGVVDAGGAAASDHADFRRTFPPASANSACSRSNDATDRRRLRSDSFREDGAMNNTRVAITRRQYLAASAGVLAAGLGAARPAFALETIRQGYQTNIWGMPTYYLLKSGLLEKRGIKFEEFAVPSGNLTMQQMVARQVDLGTYAGPSFIIGHDKGGLVAIAQIEYVGKTAQIVTRKDLNLTKVEDLKGRKVANQTGSSIGNIFVDVVAAKAGLKKGDFQEVRMNVNDMVAAMAAKTVDAMVNVEPYNAIAVAEGIGTSIMDFSSVDRMPVFMAATPDFVDKNPDTVIAYLKAWQDVGAATSRTIPTRSPT